MSSTTSPSLQFKNVGELLHYLGDVPADRIRLFPPPGQATEEDVLRLTDQDKVLCELVFGTLVEKPMGSPEALVTAELMLLLGLFSKSLGKIGHVYGPDTLIRFSTDTIRIPDVSFFKWERYPNGQRPNSQILDVIPNLVVEVLSPSNSPSELAEKRKDYFAAGVELVWQLDLHTRTVQVFDGSDSVKMLYGSDLLTGGDVLPGFSVKVSELFACLDEQAPPKV